MKKDTLTAECRQRLDEIGFVWDPRARQWEEGFASLKRFLEREGHCLVPDKHREDGYSLGVWVGGQRGNKDTLTAERRQRLDEIGFVWDALAHQWEEGFASLKRFWEREGHCLVPIGHREDGYKLGQWVSVQRGNKDTLTAERRQRLDEIGFVWDPHAHQWEEGFASLKQFWGREGHCLVRRGHREDGYKLDVWVGSQRGKKDALKAERRQRLDEIGFVWDARPRPKTGE